MPCMVEKHDAVTSMKFYADYRIAEPSNWFSGRKSEIVHCCKICNLWHLCYWLGSPYASVTAQCCAAIVFLSCGNHRAGHTCETRRAPALGSCMNLPDCPRCLIIASASCSLYGPFFPVIRR